MAELFRRWKNELKRNFVDKEKTPIFKGRYEKIEHDWPAFVAHKTSEKSKKMTETNKLNVAKKMLHHRTELGGYSKPARRGTRLRRTCLTEGSYQRHGTSQTVQGLGSSG